MWSLLREGKDWEEYQKKIVTDACLTGVVVNFGNGPREYPCLACTYSPPPQPGSSPRLVSAYVYSADAEELLAAAKPPKAVLGTKPIVVPDLAAAKTDRPRQADCNRWLMANILAILKTLRETKLIPAAERYEADLLEALELVDEEAAVRAEKLSTEDKALLAHLNRGE